MWVGCRCVVCVGGGHTPSIVSKYIYVCLQPTLSMPCIILLTMCNLVLLPPWQRRLGFW